MGRVNVPGPPQAPPGGAASPPARRTATSAWRDPRLVVGLAIVAVSVLAGGTLLSGADDSVSVWAARSDLAAGSPVGPDDLMRRDVRFTSAADADRYVSAESATVPEATLVRAVGVGELLPRAALGAADAAPVVEVPLAVPVDAVPQTVRAGSVVDVWVTPEASADGRTSDSQLVFAGVVVVAAPASGSTLAPSGTRQLLIGVEEAQADGLSEALARVARGTTVITRRD